MPKNDKTKVSIKNRDENVCDLSLSELTEVPVREIASYKRISVLDLSSNRLTSLGRNFTNLSRLVKLDLSKNQIKYLPEDFGVLQNLRHLDLYDNKLQHLPLSFGSLTSLRYLDLKGNPLTPALGKIVGFCLTTKECQDAARNTVKLLAYMQTEAEKKKFEHIQTKLLPTVQTENEVLGTLSGPEIETEKSLEFQKKAAKKTKTKSKKNSQGNHNIICVNNQNNAVGNNESVLTKATKSNKMKGKKANITSKKFLRNSSTALTSISLFILLLAINVGVIYMIMFKNPEIADKLVELIPVQYRNWIITKTEFFRLRVTDWISQLSTPPEEQ